MPKGEPFCVNPRVSSSNEFPAVSRQARQIVSDVGGGHKNWAPSHGRGEAPSCPARIMGIALAPLSTRSTFYFFIFLQTPWDERDRRVIEGFDEGAGRARCGLKSTRPITEPIRTYATDNCILLLGLCGHGLSLPAGFFGNPIIKDLYFCG